MSTGTMEQLVELARSVAREHAGTPLGDVASTVVARRDEPLRLAIAGRVKAGKSTLLNALVGEPLAPTDAGECTRVVTWYRHGLSRGAWVERTDGTRVSVPLERTPDAVVVELGADPASVRRLDLTWPAARLTTATLIDTPGVGSLRPEAGQGATALLGDDDPERAVDAVVYLTNQVHPEDWRFLEALTDDAGISPDPSCAIALLSRADEVAGGAEDALVHACTAARRAAAAPVRRVCQDVLPVSALLAAGAVQLTSVQHRQLAALAGDRAIDEGLRTATRFAAPSSQLGGLGGDERSRLLGQLGLFGVRAAVKQMHVRPATTGAELVAHLRALSGLDALLEVVEHRFLRRRDALRSRTVLRSLLSAAGEARAVPVLTALERIEAGDHELAELGVLATWRAGRLALRPEHGTDLERWLDPPRGGDAASRAELLEVLERWRRLAQHPLSRPAEAAAAQVVSRALERRLT